MMRDLLAPSLQVPKGDVGRTLTAMSRIASSKTWKDLKDSTQLAALEEDWRVGSSEAFALKRHGGNRLTNDGRDSACPSGPVIPSPKICNLDLPELPND